MKRFTHIMLTVLFAHMLVSCATPMPVLMTATSTSIPSTTTPTQTPVITPEPVEGMLEPGDKVGDIRLTTARNEAGTEPQFFDYCDPYITESDPTTITRECDIPALPYYFIGYGIFSATTKELDAAWSTMTWQLFIDGQPINLPAFGTMDLDWGDQFRTWNVGLEDPTPGEHTLRYVFDEFNEPTDVTWIFTVASPVNLELPEDADSLEFSGASSEFGTLAEFDSLLKTAIQSDEIDFFWDAVLATNQMPLIFSDFAVFLYRGQVDSVVWKGDFTEPYNRQGETDLWLLMIQFEPDTRLDYEILLNSSDYILDPLNPFTQVGGFGTKSVLRMSEYIYPEITLPRDDVQHGFISDAFTITSQKLGYDVNYRTYTPAAYEEQDNLPVIYVTDGQDYANAEMGAMVNVLDNLIADERIKPVIAVLIDPRDPLTGENRRAKELVPEGLDLCPFCDFVTTELVPMIDAAYRTDPSPDSRAILGTSLGGLFTAHMGLVYPDVFHLIAIQSPYIFEHNWIYDKYQEAERLPLKVFLNHGTYDEPAGSTRLHDILEAKDYPLLYIETHDGHSYGNWSGVLDDMLIYFFGVE